MNFKKFMLIFILLSISSNAQVKKIPPSVINGSNSVEFLLSLRPAKINHYETSNESRFFSLERTYSLPDYSLMMFHNSNILRFKRMAIEVQLGGGFDYSRKKIENEKTNLKLRETSFSPKYTFGVRLKLPYFSIHKNYFQPTLGLRNSTVMFKSDLTYSRFNNGDQSRIDYEYDLSETEIYGTIRLLNIFERTYLDIGLALVGDSISNFQASSEVGGQRATIKPLSQKSRSTNKAFLGFGMMY